MNWTVSALMKRATNVVRFWPRFDSQSKISPANGVPVCAEMAWPPIEASVSTAIRSFRSAFGAAPSIVIQPAKRQPSGPNSNWRPKRRRPANYPGTNLSFYAAFRMLFEPVGINPLTSVFVPVLPFSAPPLPVWLCRSKHLDAVPGAVDDRFRRTGV